MVDPFIRNWIKNNRAVVYKYNIKNKIFSPCHNTRLEEKKLYKVSNTVEDIYFYCISLGKYAARVEIIKTNLELLLINENKHKYQQQELCT